MLQGRHVALVDQFFLGFDVVVEAGFGQAQTLGDVAQGGGSGALGVKQLGRLRQDCRAFGIVLSRAVERRGLAVLAGLFVAVKIARGRVDDRRTYLLLF